MNLKNKILNAIRNLKSVDTVLGDIEKYQSNLMKNINSPLLDNAEKNKLLKVYMGLQDVGKSLYRYNVLKKNNHLAAAEEEKEEIEHKVLEGYICNVKYVWKSEQGENTCEECASMDGEEFYSDEDIPPKPHPNCKCEVEVYECPYEPEYSTEDEGDDVPQSKKSQYDKDKVPSNTPPQSQKWIMPCDGNLSSGFGWRKDPKTGERTYHNGWDLKTDIGTPFKAVADGKVIFAGYADPAGYAHFIVLEHDNGNGNIVTSEYGHISKHYVSYGQKVKQGQIIGATGNEGKSTGPHLHITIRKGKYRGIGVDPGIYIKR